MLKVSAVSNILGQCLTASVALVTVPLYTKFFGLDRYGSYIFLLSIQPYFGLCDMALGRGAANATARMEKSPASAGELVTVVVTGVIVSLLFATAFLFVYPFVARQFSADPVVTAEVAHARAYIVALVLATSLLSVQTGLLEGRNRFVTSNALQLFGTVASTLVPVLPGIYDGSFGRLVAGVLLGRIAQAALGVLAVGRARGLHVRMPPRTVVLGTLNEILWLSLTMLGATVTATIDRIMLGLSFGASQLYFYAVPNNLAARLSVISGSLGRALAPTFAVAEREESARLSGLLTDVVVVTITAIVLFLAAFAHDLLALWINVAFADRAALLFRLAIVGMFGLSLAQIPAMFLFATVRAHFVVKLQMIEVLPFVVAVLVASRLGLVAVAAVVLVRNVVIGVAHMYLADHSRDQMIRVSAVIVLQLATMAIFQILDGFDFLHRALFAGVVMAAWAVVLVKLFPRAFEMAWSLARQLLARVMPMIPRPVPQGKE